MKINALRLFYMSMISYLVGGFFLVVYSFIIDPIALMYHEEINVMVSPVFGNYAAFLFALFYLALAFTILSVLIFLVDFNLLMKSSRKLSRLTLAITIILYIFSFAVLLVTIP